MHTLTFPIKVGRRKRRLLEKGFAAMARCHNIVVKEAKRRLRVLWRDKRYAELRGQYAKSCQSGNDREKKQIGDAMSEIVAACGLTEASLHAYISLWQKRYKHLVSSHQAQAEASRVWGGVQKVLYEGADDIHYKKSIELLTIASKSWNGLKYYDPLHMQDIRKGMVPRYCEGIEYLGTQFAVKIDWDDPYVVASLNHKISYIQISRKMFPSGWRYYAILYLDGDAPLNPKRESTEASAGLDPGVSTVAAVTDNQCVLRELAPRTKTYNRKLQKVSAAVERSLRLANPKNYNPDGTIKKGKHKWVITKTCRRRKRLLKSLFRQKAAYIETEHGKLAADLVEEANVFIIEEMDFAALQKRSQKPAERSDHTSQIKTSSGATKAIRKFRKKKRFGSSLRDRTPAKFLSILERKCIARGGGVIRVDTRSFKASQYNHDTDTYTKTPLSQRMKEVAGHIVQRDLYSAFLLYCSNQNGTHPDRDMCLYTFDSFLKKQEACINKIKRDGTSYPACFGF